MSYKEDINSIDQDNGAAVKSAATACLSVLAKVQTSNLEGVDRAQPDQLNKKIAEIQTNFGSAQKQKKAELTSQRDAVVKQHQIFLIIVAALIVVGVIFCFIKQTQSFGALLLVAGIICFFIFKAISNGKAASIASEWAQLPLPYVAQLGHAESLHEQASGIYAEVDKLYLKSLSESARGFEMQNRAMKKQMENQNEQMEIMRQQQAEQAASLEAAVRQNNSKRR